MRNVKIYHKFYTPIFVTILRNNILIFIFYPDSKNTAYNEKIFITSMKSTLLKIDFDRKTKERFSELGITTRQAFKIIKVPDFRFNRNGRIEARRQVNGKIFALTYTVFCNVVKVASIEEKDSFY